VSRDYKPASAPNKRASKGSSFFTGLLVGLVLGVGLSVGVTVIIQGGKSPFVAKDKVTEEAHSENVPKKLQEKSDKGQDVSALPKDDNGGKGVTEKPRFDFYTILPGSESQVTEQEIKQKSANAEQSVVSENYYLQVGAFPSEEEADNLKAKLALQGIEAIVQTAEIPGKGVWHRVRVGPFTDLEQINKTRSDLVTNGFKTDLIKVRSNIPNQ
jgi:cell division protein FtsN